MRVGFAAENRAADWEYAHDPQDPAAGTMLGLTLAHRGGVSWVETPKPRGWHRCWAQTQGFDDPYHILRCPCGAIAMFRSGEPAVWRERNTRG